ncbi:helix-turn-helix transcriptional regulator [Pseudonocardia sp.]|uniref:helix-turn-helix transcriptional regulator n=1 Tax=Pseudonocardia sp. TaxID=60912 RepID=UPI00262BFDB5|nr:helix-turn-helix transcriptional regulator [Pseudonocardia sp.]
MTESTLDDMTGADAQMAEQAWRDGDVLAAIAAADRALAAEEDPECRAAGVAAAAATADGALTDAAGRWRSISGSLDGAAAAGAAARAALAAGLTGDVDAATRDLAAARDLLPDPAPRGLTVLVDGADAVLEALRGDVDPAARRFAGLAAATVPGDLLAPEPWGDLAASVAAAGGHARAARAMLSPVAGPAATRSRLLAAWLDMRAGKLTAAREGLASIAGTPVLRRNAVLAAAVGGGLARRAADEDTLLTTWHRAVPVMAGADVEILLLDAWGELSVAAARVSPDDRDALAASMHQAVVTAGSPWWAVASEHWWQLHRAAVVEDVDATSAAAAALADLAAARPILRARATGATTWAAVLRGRADAEAVSAAATTLDAAGHPWEAVELCRATAARTSDPAVARVVLDTARRLRPAPGPRRAAATDDLSDRERDVGALVVDGLTHKEIGARLYISPKTVEQHVARLRQKLAASNRAALVAALRIRLQ